jgi:hypothetical protein
VDSDASRVEVGKGYLRRGTPEFRRANLADRDLLQLYAIGALLMGGFAALYNYIGYHLLGAPWSPVSWFSP